MTAGGIGRALAAAGLVLLMGAWPEGVARGLVLVVLAVVMLATVMAVLAALVEAHRKASKVLSGARVLVARPASAPSPQCTPSLAVDSGPAREGAPNPLSRKES